MSKNEKNQAVTEFQTQKKPPSGSFLVLQLTSLGAEGRTQIIIQLFVFIIYFEIKNPKCPHLCPLIFFSDFNLQGSQYG